MKAVVKRKKEKLATIMCFNCGKKGYYSYKCTQPKKDKESVSNDGARIDQLNFEDLEDNKSCKSGDDHFNLGEYEDQDNVLTNQDVDSISDTLSDDSFVREIIHNNKYQATIGRVFFLVEQSRPDILQTIMLMRNPSFE